MVTHQAKNLEIVPLGGCHHQQPKSEQPAEQN
jgi:hypothetical protein